MFQWPERPCCCNEADKADKFQVGSFNGLNGRAAATGAEEICAVHVSFNGLNGRAAATLER